MKKKLLLALWLACSYNSSAQVFDWVKTTGNAGNDFATKMTIDSSGNVYVLGTYSGTIDLDPSGGVLNVTALGGTDIFIQKFDALGNFINGVSIGGGGNDVGAAILMDNNGYTTVAGTFEQIIDLDPSPAQNGHGVFNLGSSKDFFIAKYDDLAYAFSKAIGGAGDDLVNGMDIDSNNNVVLTGVYRQTVDFNPNVSVTNSLTTTAGGEAYVLKLNENLDYVWAKSFATTDTNGGVGKSIKINSDDTIIVAGTFRGVSDFDPNAGVQNVTAETNFSAGFVVKLTTIGNYSWKAILNNVNNNASGTTYTNTHETFVQDIALDGNNNIVIVGTFRGRNVDFDPTATASTMNSDSRVQSGTGFTEYRNTGYLWKLDSSGNYVWAGAIRTSSSFLAGADIFPFTVAFDVNNDFYFSGHFRQTIDLNPASGTSWLTSTANNDVFIGKFNGTNNNLVWARSFGGTSNVYANDIKISGAKLLLFGRFEASVDFDPNSGTQNITSQGGSDSYLLSLTETSLGTESFERNNFQIYPNPADFALNIQSEFKDYDFKIISSEGKIVRQGTSKETLTSIDVTNLTTGLYFIYLESDGFQTVQKIIKQ